MQLPAEPILPFLSTPPPPSQMLFFFLVIVVLKSHQNIHQEDVAIHLLVFLSRLAQSRPGRPDRGGRKAL